MTTTKLLAAAAVAAIVSLSTPSFAQRTSTYPEGSIFLPPKVEQPAVTQKADPKAAQTAKISPRNPLDAPDAGNVWKPSDRDAGNLSMQRWQAYQDKLDAIRSSHE